jgi:hypothetical protein
LSGLGPVSDALEAELREHVRQHGVVFFLDREGVYTSFIERLVAMPGLPYPVFTYRGSFLELVLALEDHAANVDPSPLLVHLPGFAEADVKASPLLELYSVSVQRKKALDTLVREAAGGRARPEEIEAFRAQGGLTLEKADRWLAGLLDGTGGGVGAELRAMKVEAIVDELLAGRLRVSECLNEVWGHFARAIGLPETWRDANEARAVPRPRDVAFTASSWALAVEYTTDLRRPPADPRLAGITKLPRVVIETCRGLAEHLRSRQAAFYESTANETETWLTDETSVVRAEDLGQIDTFLFEETAILKAALAALDSGDFAAALAWAEPRALAKSFWTAQAPLRQNAWQLVRDGARLGQAIAQAGPRLEKARSLDAALERYVASGAAVDRAHRLLEQSRRAVLDPQVPHFEALRARLDALRARWRTWADAWASDWNALCRTHGFLPAPELQQRTLFDQVVRPLAVENEVTAYFLVDALRFEMAQELSEALGEQPATQKQLRARLAELPTVTEVGMNVLAPVCENGRLRPAIDGDYVKGFAAGEYRVATPETRRRAMFDRVGGRGCPLLSLKEVLSRDASALKKTVEQSRLLVVHSQEIDEAGEKGVGASVFDKVLQDLRAAWRLLREAGVRRFVITADHGFLLLDDQLGQAKAHGRKVDPKRRHVFSQLAADHTGEVRVALRDLGYEGVDGMHLMCPETVTVFDTGRSGNFVHGGNSPQERVIPVLTLLHKAPLGSDPNSYTISASASEGVGGMHCLKARVEVVKDWSLNFGQKSLELGLRVVDGPSDVVVELGQTRGGARLGGSVIHADVGADFEVFFRLLGGTDARLQVELCHTGGDATVKSAIADARFAVTPGGAPRSEVVPPSASTAWLAELPSDGVRRVFEHLAQHGTITESEATVMLGGAREFRKFAREFEQHAKRARFRVRIESVQGVKRYVRDGGGA